MTLIGKSFAMRNEANSLTIRYSGKTMLKGYIYPSMIRGTEYKIVIKRRH